MSARTLVYCVSFGALFVTRVAFGQFDTGQISGFVRDSGGLVVPGATVTVTNEGNGQQRVTKTNEEGYYAFPNLLVGSYSIAAEMTGFKRFVQTGIRLSAAARISVDAVLEVGEVTETVEVRASPAAVQAETAVLGRTVTEREIDRLPISGRNPARTAMLKAGVWGVALTGFSGTDLGTGIRSINGGRGNDVLVTVDGAIANRTRSTIDTMLGVQDPETLQEIQVLTSNYAAEYGRASSGVVRMVTKSGTREFHGGLTYLFQNSALNANTWARNRSNDPRVSGSPPPWRYNNPGFTLGGPIYIPGKFNTDRSKLFFFWGEEWVRRREEVTNTLTVPTAAMRRGNFAELLDPANPFFRRTRVITDPDTRQPFANNVIPQTRLSPQGQALLRIYPEPLPGFLLGTSNWFGTFPAWQNMRKDTIKIDYLMTSRHSLVFRGTHIPYRFNSVTGSTRYDELWSRPNRTAALSLTSSFSPTFLNELTISASSDGLGEIASDSACGPRCLRSTYGLSYPYIFPASTKLDPQKIPTLQVAGLSTLDPGPYPGTWAGFSYTLVNNMTKVLSRHTLKWGIYIEYSGQNDKIQFTTASAPATNNQNGAFRFFDTGHPRATGLAIANALLGYFNDYSEFSAKPMTPFVGWHFDWFVQDSWKVTRKLNLEMGVRYSLWPPWYSKWDTIAMFHSGFYDPARAPVVDRSGGFLVSGDRFNGVVLPGSGPRESAVGRFPFLRDFGRLYHNLPRGFAETHKNAFQPRMGLGYALTSKTAVRAGAGMFLNRIAINRDLALGGQPPFMEQVTVINGVVDDPRGAQRRDFPFTIAMQDPVLKIPTAWGWNVTLQRELPWSISVEAGYVGRRGYYNQRKRNINQLLPGTLQANPGANANALRPYLGLGIIGISEHSGSSRYNAFQLEVNRRAGGLQFGVAYTYSRNKDNGSDETDVLPNAYDDRDYWGISDLNRPHVLVIHYIYDLPAPGGSRLARSLFGGWALAGIYQVQSGAPFSVRFGQDYAGVGPGSGSQFWNQVGDPLKVERTKFTDSAVWFNRNAFAQPSPGTFGKQPRNGLANPGFWGWNLSVLRRFRVSERQAFDFRWEAFNVLNHPTLGGANSNPTSGTFGLVTSKTGNRTMQVVLQYHF